MEQRLDALGAYKILAGRGSLVEAAKQYVSKQVTYPLCSDAMAAFMTSKASLNRRPSTMQELENKISRFIRLLGDMPMDQYTAEIIEEHIRGQGPHYRNKSLAVLGHFFGWAVKRELAPDNPVLKLEKATVEQPPPPLHTPEEVQRVLDACLRKKPEMLAWYVLGYFCGIRMAELKSVTWADINLDKRCVFVSPEVAKKRRQRYVELPENAIAWLRLCPTSVGRLFSSVYWVRTIAAEAGVKWPTNVMRHCFGSYHLACHGNSAKTAMEMGHTNPALVYAHYRNPVLADQGTAYFAVAPARPAHTAEVQQALG